MRGSVILRTVFFVMDITITPARRWHARAVARRLREQDRREVVASSGRDPEDAVVRSWQVSDPDMRWTAMIDGRPEIVWGVAGCADPEVGIVWLVGTDRIYEIKRRFWEESRRFVSRMHERYPVLTNWVHMDNHASIRWLTLLGFTPVDYAQEWGSGKEPFIRFESRRGNEQCANP